MTELEARVIAAVAKERRMQPSQITLDSRLYHDLGMYGDDADEFLAAFAKEMSVELSALYMHWGLYFQPESSMDKRLLLLILAVAILAKLLAIRFPVMPWWGWLVLLGLPALLFYGRLGPGDQSEYLPLTVRDFVDAAEAGRWTKEAPPAADRL